MASGSPGELRIQRRRSGGFRPRRPVECEKLDLVQDKGGAEDPRRAWLRERLEVMRLRSEKSSSWRSAGQYLSRLLNREGFVPVKTKLSREDLTFLATARDDMIAFAELGLRLVELHQCRDSGGISSDPENPIRRCRACMWLWPCPTFRAVSDAIDQRSL